jgi:hypothetical protein
MSPISVPRSADADGYLTDRLYPAAGRPDARWSVWAVFAKELREEDRIVFSDDTDAVGLPKMQLNYQLTDGDRRRLQQAVAVTERVGAALGRVAPGGEAIILPAGTCCTTREPVAWEKQTTVAAWLIATRGSGIFTICTSAATA